MNFKKMLVIIILLLFLMSLQCSYVLSSPDMRQDIKESKKNGKVINNLYVKAKIIGPWYYGYNGYVKVQQYTERGVDFYGTTVRFKDHLLYACFYSYDINNYLIDYDYDFTNNDQLSHTFSSSNGFDGNILRSKVRTKTKLDQYNTFGLLLVYTEWVQTSVEISR